jgi:multidrug transporter EmrE-like cation transporter
LGYVLLAVAILFNVVGQLLLKRAAVAGSDAGAAVQKAFLNGWFLLGGASLGVSMLLWVQVLRKIPLTVAHPVTGVVYIIVPLASHLLWSEPLPAVRVAGISVIIFGVYLVARGG